MLIKIHEGHLGINKCKSRARVCLFWPGMSKDICKFIGRCDICNQVSRNQTKQPLLHHDLPSKPWEKLGMDIFEFKGNLFLVVVDYYSKWIDFRQIKNKAINDVIKYLMELFSMFGFPDTIISDNNPFNSFMFKTFTEEHNIKLIHSSPNFPRSNGMAEKAVNNAKTLLKKCALEGGDINMFLLKYRNSPTNIGLSPAQLFLNRRLKDSLPSRSSLLKPVVINNDEYRQRSVKQQLLQKHYYDSGSKSLSDGVAGDDIYFKSKNWKRGKIVSKCQEPRSYIVSDDNDRLYRRNREHIIVKSDEEESPQTKRYDLRDRDRIQKPCKFPN
ncbi:uncharacterized protein K02A2.6-like [Coccinella septempunctata]|uniref:uncharacterized protein K02A2.6-like n=1 Tax=Coccinella septempunctata TaxID=41139 RepID=UPI001D07408C|nr:uncharacterized protein K02A2.6-like [Coccinella septempunctata]